MANVKDLLVNGAARIIGKTYSSSGFVGDLTGTATKASQDASGNIITSTYATKTELTTALGDVESLLSEI